MEPVVGNVRPGDISDKQMELMLGAVAAYFNVAKSKGFTDAQAWELAKDFHAALIRSGWL